MLKKTTLDRLFSSGIYGRLLSYAWRRKKSLLFAVLGMILYSATDTGFAALMKPLLDQNLVDNKWRVHSWLIPTVIIMVLLLRGIGNYLSVYYMEYVGTWVVKDLRTDMFKHMLQLPMSYFDATPHGAIISKITFNIEKTATVSAKTLTFLIRDTFTVIGLITWLIYLHWLLAIVFLASAPLIGCLTILASKRLRKVSTRIQKTMGTVTSDIQQAIEANLTIKIFNCQKIEDENFENDNERNRKERIRMAAVKALNVPIAMLLAGIGFAIAIYIATQENFDTVVSPGTFVSFMIAALLLFRPLRNLVRLNSILQDGLAAAESIFEFLDEPVEKTNKKNRQLNCKGHINFKNISLNYQRDKHFALKNINLEIIPGEIVALVGRSGAGKSSLTHLIPRLYEPTTGTIELDKQDITQYELFELRNQITYVPQQIVLFNSTIAKNIACSTDYNLDEITTAARRAHALEFIERLPDGFNTVLHNNGNILSGGQKQRIAIARALFKNAPILILDEATSSLDVTSERHIQAALTEVLQDRTAIIIAHRFSTIKKAKRVVVLENGQIVEQGTHEKLLENNGIYTELYQGHDSHNLII